MFSLIIIFWFQKVIDVSSGEYGRENVDRLVNNVKNGYCYNWGIQNIEDSMLPTTSNTFSSNIDITEDINHEISSKYLKAKTTSWQQFKILYRRRNFQMFRNSVTIQSTTEPFPNLIFIFDFRLILNYKFICI